MALFDSARLRKVTTGDLSGNTTYPYCPGSMVPKLSWLGNFNKDFEFIWI
jgi:hypothetical protein